MAHRSSFLSWTTFALAVVLLPPYLALVTTTVQVNRLARTGASAVLDAAERAQLSRGLIEELSGIERAARQQHELALLGDDDDRIGDRYLVRHERFAASMERLIGLETDRARSAHLGDLRGDESALVGILLREPPGSHAFGVAVELIDAVAEDARRIAAESDDAIARASVGLQADAERLRAEVLRTAAIGLPLAGGLLAIGLLTVVRPMRRLDDAIRALGAGHLDRPVRIVGPGDARVLGERIEWLRLELLRVERDREQLLHHVSHQLKSPLTCIREGAQLLGDRVVGPLAADQSAIVGIISDNAHELGHQIDDLLRASELQRSGVRLERRLVALDDLVRGVLERNAVAARARGVEIRAELEDVEVSGDAGKLVTAIDNLVANGIKFSPEGGALWVTLRAGEDEVVIAVRDEGPGIEPTERERVFESFYRGRAAWMGSVGGTGLGLAITREYVEAHGGAVWIGDRSPGTEVFLALPREADA